MGSKRYEVVSGGRVVGRYRRLEKAQRVAARRRGQVRDLEAYRSVLQHLR